MASRRNDRAPIEDFFAAVYAFLLDVPWWVGPPLAAVAFVGLRAIPAFFPAKDDLIGAVAGGLCPVFAPFIGGGILVVWAAAEIKKRSNRRRLNVQTGLPSIRRLTWREFEELVAEAYRRQGYQVDLRGGATGDGGTDLVLFRNGQKIVVQCKRWLRYRVGVKPLRELAGVVMRENAARGILITTSRLTHEAQREAQQLPIEIIADRDLERMIERVRTAARGSVGPEATRAPQPSRSSESRVCTPPTPAPDAVPPIPRPPPPCPICGSMMVRRTAVRGPKPGEQFWGCPKFPGCRGRREARGAC